MRLYGLHDPSLGRIVEWYTSLEAVRRELEALEDSEPEWAAQLEILTVPLPEFRASKAARRKGSHR